MRIESLKKPAVLIALALFCGSLLLRLVGIGWGLANGLHNQSYHPDETINFGVSQSVFPAKTTLTPGFYNYGTAYFFAESMAVKVVAAYSGEPRSEWGEIAQGILVGRFVSALAGAGTVVVLWLILRRITTQFGALFGAGLVGFAPGFVVHSRFATVDVFAAFWLALSALFALRLLGAMPGSLAEADNREPRDIRDALLAGVFAGISAGTKYTGILVLVVLWVALGLTRRPGWWKALLVGTLACFLAFCATTPGFLLDSKKFWADFNHEVFHSASGHGLVFLATPSGFIYHLINLAVGLGALLTLAGVAGLAFAVCKKHPWAFALLAFAIVYYVVIGRAEVKFLRYTFPLLLPLGAGYGYAMGTAFRRKSRGSMALAVVGVFAISGNPLVLDFGGVIGVARYTQFMVWTDPRDEAALYLKSSAPTGSVGLVSDPWFYSPALVPDAGAVNRANLSGLYREMALLDHPKVLRYIPEGDLARRYDWDTRLLTELRPDYVAYSSFEQGDVERLSAAQGLDPDTRVLVDHYKALMEELTKSYKPDSIFGVNTTPPLHDLMYIRPTIWVWKRKGLP